MKFATQILSATTLTPLTPRPFTAMHTLWLAAQCLGLKALLLEKQDEVAALKAHQRELIAQHGRDAEKIAALINRNRELTRSLHRTACAG